jgi:hypothetical protein
LFLENRFGKGKLFPQLPRGLGETWEAAGLMRCNLHKKISAGKAVKLYKKTIFQRLIFCFSPPCLHLYTAEKNITKLEEKVK